MSPLKMVKTPLWNYILPQGGAILMAFIKCACMHHGQVLPLLTGTSAHPSLKFEANSLCLCAQLAIKIAGSDGFVSQYIA